MTALRTKRVSVLTLLLPLILFQTPSLDAFAFGKPKPEPQPTSPAASIGKIRLLWRGDASTTATIGWASNSGTPSRARVYYDTVDRGTDVSKYAFSRAVDSSNSFKGMNNAFVRLADLSPATVYYFVVSDGSDLSARYWFRTAPSDSSQRLSIIAGGDSRNNAKPRRAANSLVAKLRPDAVMFGGDMTESGSDSQWNEWFDDWQLTIASDGRVTPLIITRGNHESNNDILVKLFDTNATVYYTTSIGGNLLRVYTLNTESSIGGDQATWLGQDMAANSSVTWKLAQYHKPIRPHVSSKSDGTNQYRYWVPHFERYGMDVVVECDAHTVKQTWPIRASSGSGSQDGFIRDDQAGVVYVGEGGWGAPLRNNDDIRGWTRDSGKFNHFQWFFIDSRELEIRTVRVDNADSVASLTDDRRFEMPAGIDIWSPSNGNVVKLAK